MKFSVITPSLQRESLLKCCASVNSQEHTNWEHIVMLDVAEINDRIFCAIQHPNRRVLQCDYPHRNYGNTCRHKAWEHATGDWLLYLDDDNYLASDQTLADIAESLEDSIFEPAPWAIFPIMRLGHKFFNLPPALCMTDTANVVVRREFGRWPDGPEYTMDGIWVEALKAKYPCAAFGVVAPIVVMEKMSEGR